MRHKSSTFNPHPNQLTLGIEFAPRKVRSHGLREAHTYPLVSRGKRPGREFSSFRVAAADAWNYPEIELRSATAWPSIVLDLDGANALERLIYHVEAEHICRPNWAVTRRVGGGTHAVWTLDRPVLRGDTARVAPLTLYGRINEFYAVSLEADPGYNHVLTHNPMSAAHGPAFVTNWGREDAYRLDELAEIIPFGWRVPDIPWTDVGRRVGLFRAVLAFAGKRENAEHDLLAVAIATTQARHNPPLELSYLRGVARWSSDTGPGGSRVTPTTHPNKRRCGAVSAVLGRAWRVAREHRWRMTGNRGSQRGSPGQRGTGFTGMRLNYMDDGSLQVCSVRCRCFIKGIKWKRGEKRNL